jgi:hypothetical protein
VKTIRTWIDFLKLTASTPSNWISLIPAIAGIKTLYQINTLIQIAIRTNEFDRRREHIKTMMSSGKNCFFISKMSLRTSHTTGFPVFTISHTNNPNEVIYT